MAFCEIDPFCQKVLKKHWPDVYIHNDVRSLDYWNLDENDGKNYIIVCALKNKKQQIYKILNLHIEPNNQEELQKNANIAANKSLCPRQLPIGGGVFVHGNVELKLCVETKGQTQGAETGCSEKTIQTGNTEKDTSAEADTKNIKYLNGEEGFTPETTTHVKIVDMWLKRKTLSTLITSNLGQTTLQNDLMSQTELRYVENAIRKYTTRIDILTAGFPCQPASVAGKRRGTEDDRWLWPESIRIIGVAQPTWIILENVRGLLTLEDGVVFESCLSDLEAAGYEVQTFVIPACAVNAPHRRDRVWIVGHSKKLQRNGQQDNPAKSKGQVPKSGATGGTEDVADTDSNH